MKYHQNMKSCIFHFNKDLVKRNIDLLFGTKEKVVADSMMVSFISASTVVWITFYYPFKWYFGKLTLANRLRDN